VAEAKDAQLKLTSGLCDGLLQARQETLEYTKRELDRVKAELSTEQRIGHEWRQRVESAEQELFESYAGWCKWQQRAEAAEQKVRELSLKLVQKKPRRSRSRSRHRHKTDRKCRVYDRKKTASRSPSRIATSHKRKRSRNI
jgi:hypothetical protein